MSEKKPSIKGLVLKAWAKEPIEEWLVFIHERMSEKGIQGSDYLLTARRHEATEVVRDLVLARTYKSGHNVVGKLHRTGRPTLIPVYACRATKDKEGKVIVRKSPKNKLPPLP